MNNAFQTQEITLTTFGGAIPLMDDTDLPAGGSPVNQDVDFNPGKVYTRDGLLSVFSYQASVTGPRNPSVGQTISAGSPPSEKAWSSPSAITAGSPTSYATVTVPVGGTSQQLQASAYGFSLPTCATIQGVGVSVTGKESGSQSFALTCFPQTIGTELLTNGGFETGDFTGWGTHTGMGITTSPVHSGTYAAYTSASGATLVQDNYNPVSGTPAYVRMSFWMQAASSAVASVEYDYGDHQTGVTGVEATNTPLPLFVGQWQQITYHAVGYYQSGFPTGPWFPYGVQSASHPWYLDDCSMKLISQGYVATTVGAFTGTVTIGTGPQTFTVPAGLPYTVGQTILISDINVPYYWLLGTITSYSGTTLVMNVTSANGVGVFGVWVVAPLNNSTQSVEFWFQTTSTEGGMFVSFNSNPALAGYGVGQASFCHFAAYMGSDGKLGVWNAQASSSGTTSSYNDGNLHQCVVTAASTTTVATISSVASGNILSVSSTAGFYVGQYVNVQGSGLGNPGVFTISAIGSGTITIAEDYNQSTIPAPGLHGVVPLSNATGTITGITTTYIIYVDGTAVQTVSNLPGWPYQVSGNWDIAAGMMATNEPDVTPSMPAAAGMGFALFNQATSYPSYNIFSSSTALMNACMSHVSVFSGTTLTSTQVTNHYNALLGAGGSQTNYESVVTADSPTYFWYLNETSGTVATDYISGNNGTYVGTVNQGGTYPLPGGTTTTGGLLTIQPINPVAGAETDTFTLGTTNTTVNFGGPTDLWGMPNWKSAAVIDANSFGFQIQATMPTATNPIEFEISQVQVSVYYAYNPYNFLYVKTYEQQDGTILTLALDSSGTFWQENLETTPYVLESFYTAIEPNTYALSCTLFNREFIALSNLTNATDMPRTYNGTNVDRLSQVGPGAPPSISYTTTSLAISSITQAAAVSIPNAQWTSGPNSHTPGNVIIPYSQFASFTTGLMVGSIVYLNFTNAEFVSATGTYFVTSVGQAYGMESGDGTLFYYFTVQAPTTNQYNVHSGPAVGTYQTTLATMNLATPTNTLDVGSTITVSGVMPPTWDNNYTINTILNGAQLKITQTSLSADVATYSYTLISGVAPTVGQLVTVIGCVNGPVVSGTSVFNVSNATITSTGAGTFSIFPVNTANVLPAAESGNGIVSGSEFTFEPGLSFVGTTNNPIFGNGTGGSLLQTGGLGAGQRSAVVMFLTRNNFLTPASVPVVFELTEAASAITCANLPLGPPNVIARVIAFTGAGGSQYYWIPTPVTVTNLDVPTTYNATIVNDNTTTSVTLNFTDAILLSANEIDITGANQFQMIELGSSLGVVAYSDRLFAWGEQNKVQNFVNMSFDGGSLAVSSTTAAQPLGWTTDPTYGAGGSLSNSPLFGNAYYIQNTSGSTQSFYGMITQSANQDYYNVNIINPQTQYGARVTASCPSQVKSGNLVVDLYSPTFALIYGSYTIPLASLGTGMSINTGNLLTTVFTTEASLPSDLQLRIYASNIPGGGGSPATVGGDALIDRVEVFDLSLPVLTTQFRASYVDNPEAFDGVTGNCGPNQDQKPLLGAAVLFDSLYAIKKGSMYSTSDPGTSEPSTWNWKTVSTTIGTVGIHAYDYGEDWLVTADRQGLFVFGGGPLTKVSEEIQPVWKLIKNRQATVVRNDITNRRITVQCCIPTPNEYMPEFPVNANPTTPNVILMLNYRECDSIYELANMKPLHQTYMGTLKVFDLNRKWSYWNIQSPYADFCERPSGGEEILICGGGTLMCGSGSIFKLSDTQYSDNGTAINSYYTTFGFPGVEGQQAMQLGNHELELVYGTMTVDGNGVLLIREYPNQIDNANAQQILPITIASVPPLGDYELPLNDVADRFFMRVGTDQVGSWFELSKMVMTIKPSPWAPIKGTGF